MVKCTYLLSTTDTRRRGGGGGGDLRTGGGSSGRIYVMPELKSQVNVLRLSDAGIFSAIMQHSRSYREPNRPHFVESID